MFMFLTVVIGNHY